MTAPPLTPDAAEVARGLTKAQRRAVQHAVPGPEGFSLFNPYDDMLEELEGIGVTGEDGWIDVLTPLGLRVRAILQEMNDA